MACAEAQDNKKYYAVPKAAGKTKWIPLPIAAWAIACRHLKLETGLLQRTDPVNSKIALETLLGL